MSKIDMCIVIFIWVSPVFMMGIATHTNISFYESISIGLVYSIMSCCAWIIYVNAIANILKSRIAELETEIYDGDIK